MPVLLTILIRLIFGDILAPKPRLGIVDFGKSAVSQAMEELDGIKTVRLKSSEKLRQMVESNDLDAGVVFPVGFDSLVRSGRRPDLRFYVGKESVASNRLIIFANILQLIRKLDKEPSPAEVTVSRFGKKETYEVYTVSDRLVPLLVFYALMIASIFLTSFSFVEEREGRTLQAALVTPATLTEILISKGALGFALALVMSVVTLLLNGALSGSPSALITSLAIAALMLVEVGLIFGLLSEDSKGLFTLMKSTGILFMAPVFFYLFPEWPRWIAKIFPTYWIIDPVFGVTVRGESLKQIAPTLSVAVGLCAALTLAIAALSGGRARLRYQ